MLAMTAGLLLALAGSAPAALQGPGMTWSVEARVAIPAREIEARGAAGARAELVDPIVSAIGAKGVAVEAREVTVNDTESAYAIKMTASGTVDDFRRQFYTIVLPELRGLGGAIEMDISSRGGQGQSSDLVVAATPSTGYLWTVAGDSEFSESAPADFIMHTRGVGVSQHQVLHLRNEQQRAGSIRLIYHRPWEGTAATMRVTLALDSLPPRLDLSDPTVPSATAPLPPRGTIDAAAFPAVKGAFPTSLDWRDSGIVTPVRDQGGCGSCWAFGTVGVMESALWKSGTANVNLSEQFLVSCNQSGWDCGGGLTAHRYHYDTLGKNQTEIGGVLESTMPYTASNGSCPTAVSHPYRLSGWEFIVPSEFSMPTVDQIKAAIQTYGPITAGVCAGDGWDGYTGGIFKTEESETDCGGGTNHQIILVGWNDNGGDGYWILRNSWGPGWGIGGYMYIGYGISRVGEGTSWVATAADDSSITVTSPNGGESMARGAVVPITWTHTGNPGANVKIELYSGSTLSATIAASMPLSAGTYSWTIPAGQAIGSNYTVKITSATDNTISDTSNSPFSITGPSITVIAPNGGETLLRGAVVPIRWSYTGNPGAKVKIQLYKGATLSRTISTGTALSAGVYNWKISSLQSLASGYRIKITSTTDSTIGDTSDGTFTIAKPSITVISPNGGESFTRGGVMPISWSSLGSPGASVKILLYRGMFVSRTITTSTPMSAGTYNWSIPSTQVVGSTYKIKIVSTTGSLIRDVSNAAFAIK